jgi:hypothetical protein
LSGRNFAAFGNEEFDRPLEDLSRAVLLQHLPHCLGDCMAEPVTLDHIVRQGSAAPAVRSVRPRARAMPGFDELVARYVTRPAARLVPVAIALGVLAALVVGWNYSEEGHLTPKNGTGYWLGIVGASAMLLLMVYPMRKRMQRLWFLGSVPFWFRTHMLLGIFGPLLVVFHSNFKLGALNSNVAFVVMLVVAGSGVIGRYIYGKIHMGLNGRKAAVKQILDDASQMQRLLDAELPCGGTITAEMKTFADMAMAPRKSAIGSLLAMLALGVRSQLLRARLARRVRTAVAKAADGQRWSRRERREREAEARSHLRLYFAAIGKAATFGFFERLFAAWHVLHLPLFFLLIAAALAHVFAVHFY